MIGCQDCAALQKMVEKLQSSLRVSDEERFWSRFVVADNGCWLWVGAQNKETGYGQYNSQDYGPTSTHRHAYRLAYGEPETHVLHTCDVRLCGNPEHLFDGTDQDNVDDKVSKGRHLRVVTPEKIIELRRDKASGLTLDQIAFKHGISRSCVWSHV